MLFSRTSRIEASSNAVNPLGSESAHRPFASVFVQVQGVDIFAWKQTDANAIVDAPSGDRSVPDQRGARRLSDKPVPLVVDPPDTTKVDEGSDAPYRDVPQGALATSE